MLEVTRRSRWLRYVNTVIGAKENAIQGLLSPIHIARGFGLTGSLCQSVFNSCLKMGDCNPRVLSIQSHVVSGYVGNKSATFPLQVCVECTSFVSSYMCQLKHCIVYSSNIISITSF